LKFIGQHIVDLIARFRNKVFFSDKVDFSKDVTFYQPVNNADPTISIGSSDAERLQILGSYQGTSSQTLQQAIFSTSTESGTADDGMFTFSVDGVTILDFRDAGIYLRDGMGITSAGDLAIIATGNDITVDSDTFTMTSSTADQPIIKLLNTNNSNSPAQFVIEKLRADDGVATGERLGEIWFRGQDSAQNTEDYAVILAEIDVSTSGQESGCLKMYVASHDGDSQLGLQLIGGNANSEVDVTIAAGAASVTTVSGTLTMGSTATIDNSGVVQVAAQTVIDHDQLANYDANRHFTQASITTVGTIGTGVWEGTDIEVAHGGTGASTLTDNAVLLGNGTGAVEASSHLSYYTPASNQDYLRVGDGSTTLSGIISDNAAPLIISVEGNTGTNAAGGDLTLVAGSSTGSGAGGDILFRSSAAGGSGTTVRATAEIAALDNVGNLQIDGGLTTGSTAAIDNSGVWVGGVIPSAKLDADTAHLAGAQTFTGTKTLNSFKGTAGATVTNILDEDAMGSDSATALATQQSIKAYVDAQKKIKDFTFSGYAEGNGSTYEIPVVAHDAQAPFEHNTSTGADGTTAITVQNQVRTNGKVMTQTGALKKWTGWATGENTSGTTNIALFKVTPANNSNSTVSPVLLKEIAFSANGNSRSFAIAETSFSVDVAAGDVVFTGIKGVNAKDVYFTSTLEIEV